MRAALANIKRLIFYNATDNLPAALVTIDKLFEVFDIHADNPEAGRARAELKEDLRSFPHENFVILYRKWAGSVTVVCVIHGS